MDLEMVLERDRETVRATWPVRAGRVTAPGTDPVDREAREDLGTERRILSVAPNEPPCRRWNAGGAVSL